MCGGVIVGVLHVVWGRRKQTTSRLASHFHLGGLTVLSKAAIFPKLYFYSRIGNTSDVEVLYTMWKQAINGDRLCGETSTSTASLLFCSSRLSYTELPPGPGRLHAQVK